MSHNTLVKGEKELWEVVIGLEVHAQITSNSKLFSGAKTTFGAAPNTQTDWLDAGFPGTLPVLNNVCVNEAIKTGVALHGEVQEISVFDRKNYFYPDLPMGYQITQQAHPIVKGGYVDIDDPFCENEKKRISIDHLHLEIDAGKSIHDISPTESFIDLNRSGVALMEIVSNPDMRSSKEAMDYVKQLRSILRYIRSCDADMEKGHLRVDANVSIHLPNEPLGTRAEIKNINSIRFLGQAIDFEIQRQIGILEKGEKVIQETRLFNSTKGETRSMRRKEDARDYRYFPDPDLKPLFISKERIKAIKGQLPELPYNKEERFIKDYGLSNYDAYVLVDDQKVANFYEDSLKISLTKDKQKVAKLIANWILSEIFGALKKDKLLFKNIPISSGDLAELVDLICNETISGKIAKDIFYQMWKKGEKPSYWIEKLELKQISDTNELEAIVKKVLNSNKKQLEDYREGKTKLFGYFVGEVMKATKGKANPTIINTILQKCL
ncbi:MAG: Asp-tRNA(Asn)/Glu-tRNA(Gln) amidotransferase subunit GatB [Alphaproteobacteria bacterium]